MTHPFAALQRILPQHALSRCLGMLANSRQRRLKRLLIEGFKAAYRIDMSEFEGDGAADFATFNDFFTRPLLPGSRPLPAAPAAIVSPADGTISQAGGIRDGQLLQAKGHEYAVADLVGDPDLATALAGGSFATIYLAPHNYHRVHAPCDGHLLSTLEVPGRLFSVNAVTERHVAGLFARNERLVLRLQATFGEFALVLVGALIVASIKVVWPDAPQSPYRRRLVRTPTDVRFRRGDEIGAFLIGSTVIALFPPDAVALANRIAPGAAVQVGAPIARVVS